MCKAVCLLVCLIWAYRPAAAAAPQFQVIRLEEPFQSHSLSGTVSDPSGSTLPGVLVEECEKGWTNCFAQTRTDEHGYFSWRHPKKGNHFLRLSKDGFDPLWITVTVVKSSKTDLRLQLYIAN